jgi:hypothetical protein
LEDDIAEITEALVAAEACEQPDGVEDDERRRCRGAEQRERRRREGRA